MIVGTVTVTRSMVLAGLEVASFLFALLGIVAAFVFNIPTPGFLAVAIPLSRDHYFSSFLPSLRRSLWRSQLTGYFGLR
jgi:hypothetical protein